MNTFQSIEFWLVALIVTICLLGGFGVFARWCSFSPAVRRDQLEKLRLGMTTAEIVALIGQPRESKQTAEGARQWIYGSRMKRHVLIMQFSAKDKLQSFAHGVPGEARRANPFPER
jgi:outer membrane protein assembly factor BamE (lipoprotein component of BamABCDE complex)